MKSLNNQIIRQCEQTKFIFMPTGDLKEAYQGDIQINQVCGNDIDGSLQNIYLRIFQNDGSIHFYPLMGINSDSQLYENDKQIQWKGIAEKVQYCVTFTLVNESTWFWQVNLSGEGQDVDIIYGQDIGLASPGALRSNEAYVSQYVDHHILEENGGYIIASRQNQAQGSRHPYLQQGLLSGAQGFVTDGFQFFGKEYKATNQPESLKKEKLMNEVYQYEFAYTALQSQKITLIDKQPQEFIFYGFMQPDHPDAIEQLEFQVDIQDAWKKCQKINQNMQNLFEPIFTVRKNPLFNGKPIIGQDFTEQELDRLFPDKKLPEVKNNQLLSFFLPDHAHVVLKEKEMLMERPHGHIIMSGKEVSIKQPILTSTSYMNGIFQAQTVLGNTTMNKFLSNVRNPLNFFKTSGQRIYLKQEERYCLLTIPSIYEIGFNYAKWLYKLDDDLLTIVVYTHTDAEMLTVEVLSQNGKKYDWLVTQQIVLHDVESVVPYKMQVNNNCKTVIFKPETNNFVANHYPDLAYELTCEQGMNIVERNQWFIDVKDIEDMQDLFVFEVTDESQIVIQTKATLNDSIPQSSQDFLTARQDYQCYLADTNRHFEVSSAEDPDQSLEKLNVIAWWYTHNMLVHYLVPHGLEQYGGAAWGTRDVCQGPAEYFLATQNYPVVREIIETVFSHQFIENGNWPQWFMFDNYQEIMADESHGDVIVWPLKMMADYLQASADFNILEVKVPYMSLKNRQFTTESYTLKEHLAYELDYIIDHFLFDTALSCYGDGDWDDTLQPNESRLKNNMASTWTVALTYQTVKKFGDVIQKIDSKWSQELLALAERIKQDYRKYFLKKEILPGFVLMEESEKIEYIVHPDDEVTGISYRLLPMTRSMISELFTEEEVERHLDIIAKQLTFPDGVRLMNRPAQYQGGVSTYFKRAEQASNFGREIGLQYVHAHIRYTEAMAKIGKADMAWEALQTINPILIQEKVPNAEIRQSNSYFSSSDGKFSTRYEASENFDQLRTGDVAVKGGWRIYSSGPGIYLNQLISNIFGIRVEQGNLVLDPVLPKKLKQVTIQYMYFDKPIQLTYYLGNKDFKKVVINDLELPFENINNYYRTGGVLLQKNDLYPILNSEKNQVEVYL